MQELLQDALSRAKALRKKLKTETSLTVAKASIRDEAKALGALWHTDVRPAIKSGVAAEVCDRYSESFTRLIKLSSPSNKVSSYIEVLEKIIKPFNDE
jgi:hypothetical protein